MNERVSIKEGGLTRELSPIDKVKVNNTDYTVGQAVDLNLVIPV
jgi:hypothetical protein